LTGRPRGDWRKLGHSTDRTFANKAIQVHICVCSNWMEGKKPTACPICGRMDFSTFPSKGEARTWMKLRQREAVGLIKDLERQIPIDLLTVNIRTGKPVVFGRYIADFRWLDVETGERITAECKPGGAMTYETSIKLRCLEKMGITIEVLT
jgi:hypothetical protein